MKAVVASILAITILVVAALPVAAFDTPNFARHAIAWQDKNKRIVSDMRNTPASVRYATGRLIDNVDPYMAFLKRIAPNADACQLEAGFVRHRLQVLRYAIDVVDAWRAMGRGHPAAALRFVRSAMRHYEMADTAGAAVIERCW